MVRKGRGPAHVGEKRSMRFWSSTVDEWVAAGCGSQRGGSAISGVHHGAGAACPTNEAGLNTNKRVEAAIGASAPKGIGDRPDVHSKLQQLETDYHRENNAVYAWQAWAVARHHRVKPPDWVEDYFALAADRLMQILNDVANEKRVGRQAEQVSKALGFDPAQGHRFKNAAMLERDRDIYHSVEKIRAAGIKFDAARYEVAKNMNLSYPTIERGHKRIAKMIGEDRDKG